MQLAKVIGHRGAAALAPENTLAAIRAAAQAGCTWVEIDVYPIAGGGLIIFHDDTLERCSNGVGLTQEADLDTVLSLDAGAWFDVQYQGERIPTLLQALMCIQQLDLGLNLEIKYDAAEVEKTIPPILTLLEKHWQDNDKLLLSSFNYPALEVCQRTHPHRHLGYLVEQVPDDWREKLDAIRAISLNCDYATLNQSQARAVKAAGYQLICYTANTTEAVAQHWRWGMDAVITDDPRVFAELLPTPIK